MMIDSTKPRKNIGNEVEPIEITLGKTTARYSQRVPRNRRLDHGVPRRVCARLRRKDHVLSQRLVFDEARSNNSRFGSKRRGTWRGFNSCCQRVFPRNRQLDHGIPRRVCARLRRKDHVLSQRFFPTKLVRIIHDSGWNNAEHDAGSIHAATTFSRQLQFFLCDPTIPITKTVLDTIETVRSRNFSNNLRKITSERSRTKSKISFRRSSFGWFTLRLKRRGFNSCRDNVLSSTLPIRFGRPNDSDYENRSWHDLRYVLCCGIEVCSGKLWGLN